MWGRVRRTLDSVFVGGDRSTPIERPANQNDTIGNFHTADAVTSPDILDIFHDEDIQTSYFLRGKTAGWLGIEPMPSGSQEDDTINLSPWSWASAISTQHGHHQTPIKVERLLTNGTSECMLVRQPDAAKRDAEIFGADSHLNQRCLKAAKRAFALNLIAGSLILLLDDPADREKASVMHNRSSLLGELVGRIGDRPWAVIGISPSRTAQPIETALLVD
jgi:hypothetical protein